MPLPAHMFISAQDGALHDTRDPQWSARPLRAIYSRTCRRITTAAELKATLRAGAWAWPGGYPMYFVTHDGECLSFDAVRENLAQCLARESGWRVFGVEINYEDDLYCEHTGLPIPAAYLD